MSDRYHSICVVLQKDIKDEDAKPILEAIRMLRGVLSATGNISNIESHMAETRAKYEIGQKLMEIVYPAPK